MSLLTRISWVCTFLALLGFGILAAVLLWQPLPPPTVQVRPGVVYSSDKTPPYELVRQYVEVVERYDGQTAAPLADLPASPDEIARAISTAPEWTTDWEQARTRRFYGALLFHLNNFVADPSHTTPDEIWERQQAVIRTRFEYRIVLSGIQTPVPIGRGFDALTAMLDSRAQQMLMMFGMIFVTMSFLAVRGLILVVQAIRGRLGGRWRIWGAFVFPVLLIFNPILFAFIPLAWCATRMTDVAVTPAMENAVGVLMLVIGFLLPFTFLSTLFDLLVHPARKSRPGHRAESERESERKDETPEWRTDNTMDRTSAVPRVVKHIRNRAGRGMGTAGDQDLAVAEEGGT